MKKVLIPIDGTHRGMKSVEFAKSQWSPTEAHITLLTVREDVGTGAHEETYEVARKEMGVVLRQAADLLPGYEVNAIATFGRAADTILDISHENQVDAIVMTKSTRGGWHRIIGSVTAQVVKYASALIMIVPE